ncbi:MAG: hypothetical protein JOZ53_16465, partial [Planctomycetaceae bacterium]|nr:hypothetical protein [Planctomycetaceae bacterium]
MPTSAHQIRRPGPSRRALLRAGLLGAGGLGLDDLFQLRAWTAEAAAERPARAKSCILIWLAGGPS